MVTGLSGRRTSHHGPSQHPGAPQTQRAFASASAPPPDLPPAAPVPMIVYPALQLVTVFRGASSNVI